MALPLTPEAAKICEEAIKKYLRSPEMQPLLPRLPFILYVAEMKLRDVIAVPCDTASPHRPDRAGP
jgi:hypothetical protein